MPRIPKIIRRLIPLTAKRFAMRMYIKSLMVGCPGNFDKPRISFANILPPEGSFIRGGKVKLTHLRRKWGEYPRKFNILYLVSSTLPAYPDIWVEEAKKKGVKVVWNQNGIGTPSWAPETWKKINDTMRPLKDADYVAYQSNFAKQEADDLVARAQGSHKIVTNCCDTSVFHPLDNPPPLKPLRLAVMGTHMTPEKVMIPLEALRILIDRGMDVKLFLSGPPEWPNADAEITNKIKELGLGGYVFRRGKYLQSEAPDIYRESHIYLHLKHMDSSPTAILEAMASGLAMIGSKSGGVAEWISPEAGILLDVPISRDELYYPTPAAVADAVEKIAPKWHGLSQGAREHAVKYFGIKTFIDAHTEIFNYVLKTN